MLSTLLLMHFFFFGIVLSSQNKSGKPKPRGAPLPWLLLISTMSDGYCYFNHAAILSSVNFSKSLHFQTETPFQNTIFNPFAFKTYYPSL